MNNFWKVFLKTLNPMLNWLTMVSIILVFCLDMWLFDIEAPCQFFVACGKFFYGVGLSFIAAYVFYLITVHYPEICKSKIIYKTTDFPTMAIVTNIEDVFIDMARMQGQNIDYKALNDEVIKGLLSSTNCMDNSTFCNNISINEGHLNLTHMNWLKYIKSKEETYHSHINKVRPLFPQLDSEYIAAISKIEQFDFYIPIITIVKVLEFTSEPNPITFSNSSLKDIFLELYQMSQVLRKIIEERRIRYKY